MRRLLVLLLEMRVEKITREMLKHAERHCLGHEEAGCAKWSAINDQYDDALDRLRAARA